MNLYSVSNVKSRVESISGIVSSFARRYFVQNVLFGFPIGFYPLERGQIAENSHILLKNPAGKKVIIFAQKWYDLRKI